MIGNVDGNVDVDGNLNVDMDGIAEI